MYSRCFTLFILRNLKLHNKGYRNEITDAFGKLRREDAIIDAFDVHDNKYIIILLKWIKGNN